MSHTPGYLIREHWSRRLKRFVDTNCRPEWLRYIRGKREIRGIILSDHFIIRDRNGEWSLGTFMLGVCIDEYNQRRQRQFDRVFAAIELGTATPANQLSKFAPQLLQVGNAHCG